MRFTMSDVSTVAEVAEVVDTQDADAQGEQAPEQDERQLNALLRKAEQAFTRGNKGLLISRVECGKWCHAVYVLRAEQGNKDRNFTSQLIFNRLSVHADSKRECDASELAKLYKIVELLGSEDVQQALNLIPTPKGQHKPEVGLTVGKLIDLLPLIARQEGTELYSVFDPAKEEQAKALFIWACGTGMHKRSREDIHNRVLELVDPAKYAAKQAEQAAKDAGKDERTSADEASEPEAPENLIPTEPATRPMPNWKDVPDGMVALYQEGCKQQPGKSADMMRDFAKQFVWTSAMVKGLIAGIAESKDGERAEQALQELSDSIAEEYSIFPASELAEAA